MASRIRFCSRLTALGSISAWKKTFLWRPVQRREAAVGEYKTEEHNKRWKLKILIGLKVLKK